MSGNIICGNIFEEMLGEIVDTMVMALWTFFLLLVLIICLIVIRVRRDNERNRPPQDIEILYPDGYRKVGADSEADTEAVEVNWDEIEALARQANAENNGTAPKENVWKNNKKFLIAIASIVLVGIIVGIIMNLPPGFADIKSAEVGDRVRFGNYKGSKGWIVLDKQDDKLLILSEKAICDRIYNEETEYVTWSTCSLRAWLNTDYLTLAFSEEELESIADTSVYTAPAPTWKSEPGEYTIDKVFLLSIEEAEKYFSNNAERMITTTRGEKCWWWLRTPCDDYTAAYVYYDGEINGAGSDVDNAEFSVRPAMWINLKAD